MIRFGVIGTNWITERFLEAAQELDDFVLTAVCSRKEEKAKTFAAQHGASHTYTTITEMAASPYIDAVYIATPNALHAEQAILCMQNGKHVICEKPLASNEEEVLRMMAAAKEHDVLLMEAMKSTCTPNFKVIQENLHKIGPIRRYFSSFCQYSSRYDTYKQGTILNAFNPALSNGALMDIGVYCIYPLVTLFGKPQAISATGTMLDSGVDGQGSILFQYKDKEATVIFSKITNSYLPTEIQGERGTMIINKISSPSQVSIVYHDGTTEELSVPQKENTMYYEAEEFIHLLQHQQTESSINTLERSLATIQLMDEARKQVGLIFPADTK
ncbi:MAG: Gfo/Idh/MocA family protein [Bacillus sp. (in: firmicutes)]